MAVLEVAPASDWPGLLSAWRFDPLALAVVLAAGWAYAVGVARVRRDGGSWPAGRTGTFVLGIFGLAVTTMGWPAVFAPLAFSVYAGQMMALMLVIPLLLAIGRPIRLAKAALSPAGAARLEAVLQSRAARPLTVPVISPLLLAVIPFAVFFTPLFRHTLTSPGLLAVLQVALLVAGLAVIVPLWEADTIAVRFPYVVALLFAFIELLADAVPGIVIRLETHVFAGDYFATVARPWGSTPLQDQQLGGNLLWCIGEAIDIPFLALLLLQWIRADAREAAQVDQLLDAQPRLSPEAAAVPDDGAGVPWWVSDASVFGDRASQFERPADP